MSERSGGAIEARLADCGLALPEPPKPVGNFVPVVQSGNLLFVSGHGPEREGQPLLVGRLGDDMDVDDGREATRLVALNVLASVKAEIHELERVRRVVKLLRLVNSAPEFKRQPDVANGASDVLVAAFGEEAGRHARSAIGVSALPSGIPVEIEAILEITAEH